MFKVISDIMAHWYDLWNTIVIAINFCNAKKMICALMFILSNHYGIKCLSNLLQLEPCNVMFNLQCNENDLCIDVHYKHHYGIKCHSNQLH